MLGSETHVSIGSQVHHAVRAAEPLDQSPAVENIAFNQAEAGMFQRTLQKSGAGPWKNLSTARDPVSLRNTVDRALR